MHKIIRESYVFFKKRTSIENNMIIIISFLFCNADLRFRTYSVALFWHYQDKVKNFICVLYFLPFSTLTYNTLSLECTKTSQYNFAPFVHGRCIHISHKDTLQRIININFKLSFITQKFLLIILNSYSIIYGFLFYKI
jgi:hypothetical protein